MILIDYYCCDCNIYQKKNTHLEVPIDYFYEITCKKTFKYQNTMKGYLKAQL